MKSNNTSINKVATEQINCIQNACERIKPLVVIQCTAYNHELYIKDALDGFVMQKTDFPFVAIVHDDASTDKTAEIIKEYSEKYPDIILPIFEKENQYSKRSLGSVMRKAAAATGAKYIAICEGDDYWTDSLKLQKQVDFLDSHPDYSMCFHTVDVLHQDTCEISMGCNKVDNKDYMAEDVLLKWVIPTCSVVMRIDCRLKNPDHKNFIVGDNVLWASCLSMGKIKGFSESRGVYRRVSTGWTARNTNSRKVRYDKHRQWIAHYQAMKLLFPKIDCSIFDKKLIFYMASRSSMELLLFKRVFFKNFKQYYKEFGIAFLKEFCVSIFRIVQYKVIRSNYRG